MIQSAETKTKNRKGGRPSKTIKRDRMLGVKCTLIEKKAIEAKAKTTGLTVSEYLRGLGLNGKIDMRKALLTKEI